MIKKNFNKFIKSMLLIIVIISNLIISTQVLSLTQDSAKKGDIYNPQTNSIGDSSTINAYNYDNNKTYQDGDVEVRKIVSKTDTLGKYKVEFQIRGKNTTEGIETTTPLYVVVVLDRSNSMRHDNKWTNGVSRAKEFAIDLLKKVPTAKLALVEFSGKTDNTNYSDAEVIRNFENKNFNNTDFGNYGKNGGATNLGEGLRYAYNLLNLSSVPLEAYKYVVVLSDGEPTVYTDFNGNTQGNAYVYEKAAHEYATKWANKLNNELDADIFTIGYEIISGSKAETVLKGIANKSSYYVNAGTSDIVSKFKNVTSKFDIEYSAGTNVELVDKLGNDFTLKSGDTTLKLDAITENWTSLGTFYIAINEKSAEGWYPTNNGFKVTYKDYKGKTKEIICSENPEVYWHQDSYAYTVNYYFNNKLDESLTKKENALFNSDVFAKDHYLEDIALVNKNNNDNTNYYLEPLNINNTNSITITHNQDNNVLNIYYIDTSFVNEIINKKTDIEIIKDSNIVIPYTIEYSVDINNIKSNDKIITVITDKLSYEIDIEKSSLNGGIYNKESKTITWTFEQSIDEFKEKYNIRKEIDYSVVYKEFSHISSIEDNNLVNSVNGYTKVNDKITKGVDDKEQIEVLIEGKVIAIYVDENDNKLADDSNFNGLVGENYETVPKDILGYTLIEEKYPQNSKGKFTEEDIIVKYIYTKNMGDITHSITKEGLESINSINDKFDYRINLNAIVKDYVGNIKLKVIDILPYKIDENKSNLDNRCKYDSNLEIICEIDYGKNAQENIFSIYEIFAFELYFIDIDSDTIINEAISEITLENISDKQSDNAVTNIAKGNVIVNYVTKENIKLHDTITISGLAGTNYETTKKEFDKYSFIEVVGEVNGEMEEGTKKVTYIYDLTPLPPHTGTNKLNFNSYIKYCLYFILVIGLVKLFRKIIIKLI